MKIKKEKIKIMIKESLLHELNYGAMRSSGIQPKTSKTVTKQNIPLEDLMQDSDFLKTVDRVNTILQDNLISLHPILAGLKSTADTVNEIYDISIIKNLKERIDKISQYTEDKLIDKAVSFLPAGKVISKGISSNVKKSIMSKIPDKAKDGFKKLVEELINEIQGKSEETAKKYIEEKLAKE